MMIMAFHHAASDSRKCSITIGLPLDPDDSYSSTRLKEYVLVLFRRQSRFDLMNEQLS